MRTRVFSLCAQYIFSQIGDLTRNYRQITFIRTGIGPEDTLEGQSRQEAQERNWSFESIPGRLTLLERLLQGFWSDADFAVVPPGHRLVVTHNGRIFAVEKGTNL